MTLGRIAGRRRRVLGIAAAAFTSPLLRWSVAGLTAADFALVGTCLTAFPRMRRDPKVRRLMSRASAPLWVFALGSTIALSAVGFAGWAVVTVATDAFLVVAFFALYYRARRLHAAQWRIVLLTTAAAVAVVTISVVFFGSDYRPPGTFRNPNYTAHWMGTVALFLIIAWPGTSGKVMIGAVATVVTFRTGSFGGIGLLAVGLCFLTYAKARQPGTHLYWRLTTAVLAISAVFAFADAFERLDADADFAVNSGVSAARFEGSSDLRRQLWSRGVELFVSSPSGVGPGGIANRNLLGRGAEVHNDYLALLIERGAVGAIGFGAFAVVLWRTSAKGGAFRTLAVAAIAAGVFRETLHFRHLWLFLALALAWDARHREAAEVPPKTATARTP